MEHYAPVRCSFLCFEKERKLMKLIVNDELEIIANDGLLSNRLLMNPACYKYMYQSFD